MTINEVILIVKEIETLNNIIISIEAIPGLTESEINLVKRLLKVIVEELELKLKKF